MATFVLHPDAANDLIRIDHWFRRTDPETADRFRRAVLKTADRYAAQPGLGSPFDYAPATAPNLRFTRIGRFRNHILIYRPIAGGIEVTRVVHAGLFGDPS